MRAPTETAVPELLNGKRFSQFWLVFSSTGLVTGWPYSSAVWAFICLGCLLWLVSTSGSLWLARNPGAHPLDFYRTRYWWLKLLDFELKKEPKE